MSQQTTVPLEIVLDEMAKVAGRLAVDLAVERARVRSWTPLPVEEEVAADAAD